MKLNFIHAAVAFAVCIMASVAIVMPASAASTPAPAAPSPKAPSAKILFLDRSAVLRRSNVGKDMATQVKALVKKMEADFAPENKKLQADTQALKKQISVLAPDVRQRKIKEIEDRRQAFQKKIKERQASIQAGLAQARRKVEQALGPILEKLMTEQGANLLLDRGLVVLGRNDLDITPTVIARLNTALPKLAVTPVAVPARPAAGGGAPATPGASAKPAAAAPAKPQAGPTASH
ncbi:MAG: hypothetical protein GC190_08640 [Alphaproteobacteria bacterium]|nr:hypothetical protein [Alphaproteobacteria bacterium]